LQRVTTHERQILNVAAPVRVKVMVARAMPGGGTANGVSAAALEIWSPVQPLDRAGSLSHV